MKNQNKKRLLSIICAETSKSVKDFDVTSKTERQIDKLDSGISRNLDHSRFYTLVREVDQ